MAATTGNGTLRAATLFDVDDLPTNPPDEPTPDAPRKRKRRTRRKEQQPEFDFAALDESRPSTLPERFREINRLDLRKGDRKLLKIIALLHYQGDGLVCDPSIDDLTGLMECDRKTTFNRVDRLESCGYVHVVRERKSRRKTTRNIYRLGPDEWRRIVEDARCEVDDDAAFDARLLATPDAEKVRCAPDEVRSAPDPGVENSTPGQSQFPPLRGGKFHPSPVENSTPGGVEISTPMHDASNANANATCNAPERLGKMPNATGGWPRRIDGVVLRTAAALEELFRFAVARYSIPDDTERRLWFFACAQKAARRGKTPGAYFTKAIKARDPSWPEERDRLDAKRLLATLAARSPPKAVAELSAAFEVPVPRDQEAERRRQEDALREKFRSSNR